MTEVVPREGAVQHSNVSNIVRSDLLETTHELVGGIVAILRRSNDEFIWIIAELRGIGHSNRVNVQHKGKCDQPLLHNT